MVGWRNDQARDDEIPSEIAADEEQERSPFKVHDTKKRKEVLVRQLPNKQPILVLCLLVPITVQSLDCWLSKR